MKVKTDGTARRETALRRDHEGRKRKHVKWFPKRETWPGVVSDDDATFGPLYPGHEVEVLLEQHKYRLRGSAGGKLWRPGVVIAVNDEDDHRVAVCTPEHGTLEVYRGQGFMRRPEDSREMCAQEELNSMATFRCRGQTEELFEYALGLNTIAGVSHAVMMLCTMGEPRLANSLLTAALPVNSIALRQLGHAHAMQGNVEPALDLLGRLPPPLAAQLLVEVLAIALSARIVTEAERGEGRQLPRGLLKSVETNPAVARMVAAVSTALPLLETLVAPVRDQPPRTSREGLTEAFNELLMSCGRAHAVPLAFRVLEWMETMAVPKDNFTYEAVGLNVVKRVRLVSKVWDLPNAPEEGAPEVVFAGRSNVGKSSLVNMLLSRLALAPTSSRPGKTRTLDFFDVNAGHPALPRFRLVDVPGLGYAAVSKDMRQRWIGLIGGYFVQRKSLKIVFHLLDAGLCEILPADQELWRLLAEAQRTDYQLCIALTKADRSLPSSLERFAKNVREALRAEGSQLARRATIFACSAKSKLGKDTLWRHIWNSLGADEEMAMIRQRQAEERTEEEEFQESLPRVVPPVRLPKMLQILQS